MKRFDYNKKYVFSKERFAAVESRIAVIMAKDILNKCDGKEVEILNSISGIIKGDDRDFRIVPRWCKEADK